MKSKRLLLFLLFALLAPWAANAQTTVTIGEGTATCNTNPIGTYYNYSISEQLYTAEEIGTAGTISSISFYYMGIAARDLPITVYMANVDAEDLTSGISLADADEVFSGTLPVTTTAGWVTINLATPFDYDGTSNLLIGFIKDYLYYFSGQSWQGTATTTTMARYTQSDSAGPYTTSTVPGSAQTNRPNIQIVITPSSVQPCYKPTLAVSEITHNQATLTVGGGSGTYNVQYKEASATTWTNVASNSTNTTFTLSGLTPLTAYDVQAQSVCEGGATSDWKTASFSTTAQAELVGDSWSDDFEGTSCGWELINGSLTNKWCWGTAANNGGRYGLYVSNDNGTTNAYNTSSSTMVYATKLLNFTEGKFEFSYDWICNGESGWDFLRVALVPSSVQLSAGTSLPTGLTSTAVPSGWIALDGGSQLQGVTAWQNKTLAVNVTAGNYYLVMAWRNDGSGGSTPPAAVDNVSITKMACPYDVTDLVADRITTTGATLAWNGGEASQWQVMYANNANFTNATAVTVREATCNITGLTHSTVYYVKVRAYCGGEDFGSWCNVISFPTECEVITTYPYTENFDSYTAGNGVLPICWSKINTTTYSGYQGYPRIISSNYHSSPNSLYFSSYYTSSSSSYDPQPQYAILPEMQNLSSMRLKLYAKASSTSASYDATFHVGIMTDPADATTFTEVASYTPTSTTYANDPYVIPFNTYTGNGNYIAIMIEGASEISGYTYSYHSVYIDDITVEEIPNCLEPTGLAKANVTPHTVDLNWTSEASAWVVAYKTADDENFTEVDVTTNPYTLTGLIPETAYTVKVKANCGEGVYSAWTNPISFTTGIACTAPTGLVASNITGHNATITWTAVEGAMYQYALVKTAEYNANNITWSESFEGNTQSWNNLDPETGYTFALRKDCGSEDGYSQMVTTTFTTDVACPAPTNLAVAETSITSNQATATWNGTSERYVVMIGQAEISTVTFDFEDQAIPANFTNDATRPWTVTAGGANGSGYCAIPGNAGVNSSQSDLTCEVTGPCTVSFVAKVSSESGWDKGYFLIDGTEQFNISGTQDWTEYSYELTEGTHTLIWRYYKDGSGDSGSDLFYVDNITMPIPVVDSWTEYTTTEQTYTFENLNPETLYQVKVKGNCGDDGYSVETAPVNFTTLANCPVPANLNVDANSITAHEATLTWTADNDSYNIRLGEVSYLVTADFETGDFSQANFTNGTYAWSVVANDHSGAYCAMSATGNHSQTSTLELTVTVENDETLTFSAKVSSEAGYDKAYFYIDNVAKINAISGDGEWIDYNFPLTAGTHTLSWQYTKDSSVSGGNDCFYVDDIQITNGANVIGNYTSNTTSYDFTRLAAETTYSVQVQGVCDGEPTAWSQPYSFTTAIACPAPTDLVAGTPEAHSVSLSWTETGGAEAWQICVNNDETNLIDVRENPYTLTGLSVETEYTVKVRANCGDEDGVSQWSNTVSFTTAESPCAKPTELTLGTVGAHEVLLSWTENGEATEWQVCVNDDETNLVTATTNEDFILEVTPDTYYKVKVRANCGYDQSGWSNTVRFTTEATCPAPANLTASNLTQHTADISWEGTADSYNVMYREATVNGTVLDPIFEDDFENGLDDWTTYAVGDYTGDETSWRQFNATGFTAGTNHSGDYVAVSRSYNGSEDVSVDNWLVSPQMMLGDVVKFWVAGDDADYQEYYAVYVSTGTNAISDFVMVEAPELAPGDGTWAERTVDLSAYAGQEGYVAIRHTDYAKDYLLVDDFGVYNTLNTYSYANEQTMTCTTTSCALSELIPETYYEVNVQSNCGGEDGTSRWATIYFTTPDACTAPTSLASTDITATTATLSWADNQDSYNVRYRKIHFFEGFEGETLPTGWTTIDANEDGNTWGIGHATTHSGNNGAANISYIYNTTGTTPDDYLISPLLDLQGTMRVWLSGFGTSNAEHFEILLSTTGNTAEDFTVTLVEETTTSNEYVEYTADLSSYAGQQGYIAIHHFNCTDQRYLYVDDFAIYGSEGWVPVDPSPTEATVTLTGLTPETTYEWQVQGVDCDGEGGLTDWSAVANFTTLEQTTLTQTIALSAGSNWVSFYVEITLDDLKAALVAASPDATIKISGKSTSTTYVPRTRRWSGSLQWDLAQMYMIKVAEDCEISLEGMPINPAEHPVTIVTGTNYIAFPLAENMSLTNAFAGFAVNGDKVLSKTSSATYNRGRWQGQGLTNLVPGNGYIYKSVSTESRTFVFPILAK